MKRRTTTVRVDQRGRITIPKPMRKALDLEGGEYVEITISVEDGDSTSG